jgi:hypothetical protein
LDSLPQSYNQRDQTSYFKHIHRIISLVIINFQLLYKVKSCIQRISIIKSRRWFLLIKSKIVLLQLCMFITKVVNEVWLNLINIKRDVCVLLWVEIIHKKISNFLIYLPCFLIEYVSSCVDIDIFYVIFIRYLILFYCKVNYKLCWKNHTMFYYYYILDTHFFVFINQIKSYYRLFKSMKLGIFTITWNYLKPISKFEISFYYYEIRASEAKQI